MSDTLDTAPPDPRAHASSDTQRDEPAPAMPRLRPEAGQLAQFLPYQLSVASNAVSDLIADRYRERFGLKILEWRVMAVLGDKSGVSGYNAMTQRALTEAILTDKVAINRACKGLESRGLIARVPNATDGRSHLMVLTEEGRAIHAEVLPMALETERELLADFSEAEQGQLRAMLERLRRKVDDLA
ncbi:MAG: MarR family winged helix-turn-helix transcriptional regulator [Pseudomonadota bacterium]